MLKGKKIILGITGSIAAYKAAFLTRLLVKAGADVRIIITPYGKEFITPLTLSTLSGNPVLSDFFDPDHGDWNSHVDMGLWADLLLIAPATANTLAKMAHGVCDNLLLTTYLSVRCEVAVAPAMDLDMLAHPATRDNIQLLQTRGVQVIEPATGELASRLEGKGRMEEPETILAWVENHFKKKSRFSGKKVLVTAGPTHEPIDPVRFIGNWSSGKMGYSLAEAFASQGAEVYLVSGPVEIPVRHPRITLRKVETGIEMYDVCAGYFDTVDIALFNAAVSDYRPFQSSETKIKRGEGESMNLELTANPDIAWEFGRIKRDSQLSVGFALETNNEVAYARTKMEKKRFNLIILNSLQDKGAGFGGNTNQVTLLHKDNKPVKYELKSKEKVALDILDAIETLMRTH